MIERSVMKPIKQACHGQGILVAKINIKIYIPERRKEEIINMP